MKAGEMPAVMKKRNPSGFLFYLCREVEDFYNVANYRWLYNFFNIKQQSLPLHFFLLQFLGGFLFFHRFERFFLDRFLAVLCLAHDFLQEGDAMNDACGPADRL